MKIREISEVLGKNTYPGRGILLGTDETGNAIIAYFIMGRSENSRNRIFVKEGGGVRTEAFDPAKLMDPSLVIYSAVRTLEEGTIVTNGDQTDTVFDYMKNGQTFAEALRTRTFEPDPPIFTPRISGYIAPTQDNTGMYQLSILKCLRGDDATQRFFYEYEMTKGIGHLIHTYASDGDPVPSFSGEPVPVLLRGNLDDLTEHIWNALNEENKVSLFVRAIDFKNGEVATRIVNKNQNEQS